MSRRKPFTQTFSAYLSSISFLFSQKKQRRPSLIRGGTNAFVIVCPFFFPFLAGRFIPNRDPRRLSNGSGTRWDVRDRRKPRWVAQDLGGRCGEWKGGRTDGRVDEEEGLGTTDVPESPSAGPPSVTWRFLEGQLNI